MVPVAEFDAIPVRVSYATKIGPGQVFRSFEKQNPRLGGPFGDIVDCLPGFDVETEMPFVIVGQSQCLTTAFELKDEIVLRARSGQINRASPSLGTILDDLKTAIAAVKLQALGEIFDVQADMC